MSERVRAGMARAKQEGKRFGNRPIETQPAKWQAARAAVQAVESGEVSYRKAAQLFGASLSTIRRTQAKLHPQDPA